MPWLAEPGQGYLTDPKEKLLSQQSCEKGDIGTSVSWGCRTNLLIPCIFSNSALQIPTYNELLKAVWKRVGALSCFGLVRDCRFSWEAGREEERIGRVVGSPLFPLLGLRSVADRERREETTVWFYEYPVLCEVAKVKKMWYLGTVPSSMKNNFVLKPNIFQ